MKGINYFTAYQLKNWGMEKNIGHGEYTPARPIGQGGIKRRFKMAWLVFTGKCDVVRWKKQ